MENLPKSGEEEKMDVFDYWRLCDKVSIFQAILLILGRDPASCNGNYFESDPKNSPSGYWAVRTALLEAIRTKNISSEIVWEKVFGMHAISHDQKGSFNIFQTHIPVVEIKKFLSSKGIKSGFFFTEKDKIPKYLDRESPFYAPKLAAAIKAWEAVTADETLLHGKTPKKALDKWLRENANLYSLTKDDGNPNETGIEEVCKIANWKPEGGASKTPEKNLPTAYTIKK